ncbi:MAG: hypothetical protein XXXJIFNMEKO3_03473 [Candidatus Erwinia impunctatus]|nr:hypothetical protein XXXJIFNMEKO_03473 [Culicoides impunctatus]
MPAGYFTAISSMGRRNSILTKELTKSPLVLRNALIRLER